MPAAEPKPVTLGGHPDFVYSVAFSPDGKTLASGSGDNTIKLWDVPTGKEQATLKGHTGWVTSVAFSPDGKTLASGSWDKTIKLWDVATGKELATLQGHTSFVLSVAFSPDGKTLASASGDKTIKLWDVADGQGDRPPSRDTRTGFSCVAFSPDGKTLASGSVDKTIKLWDVATGKERATLKGHTRGTCVRGVQPGRQDAGLGEPGQHDQVVGRGDGQGAGHPQGTHGAA